MVGFKGFFQASANIFCTIFPFLSHYAFLGNLKKCSVESSYSLSFDGRSPVFHNKIFVKFSKWKIIYLQGIVMET